MVVNPDAIGGVLLAGIDAHQIVIKKLPVPGQRINHCQTSIAQMSQTALEVQNPINAADIDSTRRVIERGQHLGQLPRARFVRALRNADEKVIAGFADVTTVQCPR